MEAELLNYPPVGRFPQTTSFTVEVYNCLCASTLFDEASEGTSNYYTDDLLEATEIEITVGGAAVEVQTFISLLSDSISFDSICGDGSGLTSCGVREPVIMEKRRLTESSLFTYDAITGILTI